MNTAPNAETLPLIPVPWAKKKVDNFDAEKHVEECHFCGRGLTEKAAEEAAWIEMTTDHFLIPEGHPEAGGERSQGCFQVGQTCARKVPKAYRVRVNLNKN